MKTRKSLLNLPAVDILPNLTVRIPTVGEILEDEAAYYSMISAFTASPFQYMVQLDDMGIDYTAVTDYELFKMLFPLYVQSDLSILFGDLNLTDFALYCDQQSDTKFLYSPGNQIIIDEHVYHDLADAIRKINMIEKVTTKPGNESARKYLLEKERKKQMRNAEKPYQPYLEKLVIALVNTCDFPYDYDSCMNLSIYRFNQSFKQIQHKVVFDHTMIGIYAGTIDTSKLRDQDALSWISNK